MNSGEISFILGEVAGNLRLTENICVIVRESDGMIRVYGDGGLIQHAAPHMGYPLADEGTEA